MGGIFNRFNGSTDPSLVDVSGCDTIVEPFAGSLRCTVHYLGGVQGIRHAIVADADPSVRAVIAAYRDAEIRRKTYVHLQTIQKGLIENPSEQWKKLKQALDHILSHRVQDVALSAAISIAYRAVAHAGIVRSGKSSGKINVSPGRDQLQNIGSHKWFIPEVSPKCDLALFPFWELAIKAIPRNAKAIVLIDPPYWSPIGMEPCYPGHQPKSDATLALFHQCLGAAISHPGVHRIVAKNYFGHSVNGARVEWPEMQIGYPGWHMHRTVTGELRSCGHGRTHGDLANKPNKPKNLEAFWTFQKQPFNTQLLLEV